MDIAGFAKVAPYLTHPLVLVGLVLMLVFGMHKEIVKSGLLPQVSKKDGSEILKLILRYGFWLGLVLVLAGFLLQFSGIGLSAWNSYMDKEKVVAVNAGKVAEKLYAQLDTKDQQLSAKDEQIKALTEAITALAKADAPAKSINEALQELEKGNTGQAQAIFAEVLRSKEAEGKKDYREAAAAARHLGALAYMNNPKEALIAYQKAVELDPDNAEGWNMLGHLLLRIGEFNEAERAYRNTLDSNDKILQISAFDNLGLVYETRGDFDQAEEMYKKSLAISETLEFKGLTASTYEYLGDLYITRDDLDQAGKMYKKALEIDEFIGRPKGSIAFAYRNLGRLYKRRSELDKAEAAWQKSLSLYQEMGHPNAKKVQQALDELAQIKAGGSR